MIVELTAGPADRVEADLLVVFLHADDRPPAGMTGLVDWRLNGLLSRHVKSGWFDGEPGEPLVLAGGRRTRTPRLLVMGLGRRREAGAERLREAGADALAWAAAMRLARIALALPPPGEPPLPEAARVRAVVEGLLRTATGPRPPEVRPQVALVLPLDAQPDAMATLSDLRARAGAGYHFDLRPLAAVRPSAARPLAGSLVPIT